MDSDARREVAAATAAHAELGSDYDSAVAEGLVERIGAEIDKRVDARLRERGQAPMPARPAWVGPVVTLGSLGIGVAATGAVLLAGISVGPDTVGSNGAITNGSIHNVVSGRQILLVALIWVVIAVVNIAYHTNNTDRR